ncbi:cation:proton antiporter [Geodermatophilus marinus]|uniref:cation:proton antiporter n=1 Tax=Geodermatophilus sp. LHW52908 TaxID=2303986 RepID=UPI000E3E098C|nr:cation:proton antiporter [Geodermatophilus sp. LHW52908]RFU20291.1 cation:proton antiporter [Geodermatophilus sp. LHW52908]
MDGVVAIDALVAVLAVSLLAPVLVGLLPRLPVPQVVLLLAGGVAIGPSALGLSSPGDVQVLADVGLGFVFLLAGYEFDLRLLRADPGRRAIGAWGISAVLALGIATGFTAVGLVESAVPVAIGLTTTALGTLLPILREHGLLHGRFGRYLLAAGGVGELFPVVAIAVFLGTQSRFTALLSIGAVAAFAGALAAGRHLLREGSRLSTVVLLNQHETAQVTLRATMLLLVALIAVTDQVHLDAVLGAFLAGMVLRHWVGASSPTLESKLDAVGYGFFVPVFFVYSGMGLDLEAIAAAPLLVLLFFGLMVAVRGLPALGVYRAVLPARQRVQTVLVSATALPVLVALAEIGQRNDLLSSADAAALVGAGALTVLLLPALAVAIDRPAAPSAGTTGSTAASGERGVGPGTGS